MEVKILKRSGNELKLEIEGEDHTLCSLLEKVLLEDESVDMAGYTIQHPLISNPVIYIRTKGGRKPETALEEAAKKILQNEEEFRTKFNEALERWKEKQRG